MSGSTKKKQAQNEAEINVMETEIGVGAMDSEARQESFDEADGGELLAMNSTEENMESYSSDDDEIFNEFETHEEERSNRNRAQHGSRCIRRVITKNKHDEVCLQATLYEVLRFSLRNPSAPLPRVSSQTAVRETLQKILLAILESTWNRYLNKMELNNIPLIEWVKSKLDRYVNAEERIYSVLFYCCLLYTVAACSIAIKHGEGMESVWSH
nr:PREDICTED: uncharacterized protein LOC106702973 [Latimeria chalumnae]|eukprot:XP_014342239.1 PREDICTED: uncharacterized protein LOC106702973 [Latimeria chalumnae]